MASVINHTEKVAKPFSAENLPAQDIKWDDAIDWGRRNGVNMSGQILELVNAVNARRLELSLPKFNVVDLTDRFRTTKESPANRKKTDARPRSVANLR